MTPLVDITEASKYLCLSTSTVYKKCCRRELRFVKEGGALRFRVEDLDQYVQEHIVEPIKSKD